MTESIPLQFLQRSREAFKISTAEDFARGFTAYLKADLGVERVVVAGSFRRRRETVGDLDILITCENGPKTIEHFVAYDEIAQVLSKGLTRSTVSLGRHSGRYSGGTRSEQGAALHYFAGVEGSQHRRTQTSPNQGLKLNEYGVFRGLQAYRRQHRRAGLPFIEPELRENRVDRDRAIEAAKTYGCFLEVNAHSSRLDLGDIHCRKAKDAGVKLAISTDAYSTTGLSAMRHGVHQARRGWVEKDDVLDTRSWGELKKPITR